MNKSTKKITAIFSYKSERRIPMPPPTRFIPMKKRTKLEKISRREMAFC